ncbi:MULTISPECIES: hypothetical protein [Stenotrophomonas]|uniref:hypothetical protein n=1 Tax=Stenotrophomonas TaxID=40323 RepID=UPI000D53D7FA|nr:MULTISPECIES: hypothetical protein [Stenotrophomonas]AWH37714.1 hypothetical protein C1929_13615 [Stenotrophomonas sp. ZAC14D1_NAIMI4_6]AWH41848.1 hypothetical protein C1927_13625 [Stenotrophomonas sp. ZAC14D1_NAIMI4_1]AWH44148.1 hypothetical protein C1926_03465 [Stenotrophomonas sp. ZAC14A_NAIMI4_1]
MKKLLLLLVALLCLGLAGCDQDYRNHRAERGKPKISVSESMVTVRRQPAPNIIILPDGTMKVDEIQIPLNDGQRQMLQTMFGKLQVLRQNTLVAAPADPNMQPVKIQPPEGMEVIPPDLVQAIPEFKDYTETFGNIVADRR